jgi:hypothetical protein
MHHLQAALEHRWIVPVVLTVGIVAMALGIAIHGDTGSDLRLSGAVLFLAAFMDSRIRSVYSQGHRIGHRQGRRVGRAELNLVPVPRRDERASSR